MLYGFSFLPSSVAACYLCCHLHRWTRLHGTYPMISSISGPINTISNVPSLHMTVCLKTSLSPSLRPRRQCVGANDLCCLCGTELREWLSGGGFWNWDGCIMHCFPYLLHRLNDVLSAFAVGGTYAIWRGGSLLLLNWHYKKLPFWWFEKVFAHHNNKNAGATYCSDIFGVILTFWGSWITWDIRHNVAQISWIYFTCIYGENTIFAKVRPHKEKATKKKDVENLEGDRKNSTELYSTLTSQASNVGHSNTSCWHLISLTSFS